MGDHKRLVLSVAIAVAFACGGSDPQDPAEAQDASDPMAAEQAPAQTAAEAAPAAAPAPAAPAAPAMSAEERAAKDRMECQTIAMRQTGFDPLTAEAPPRTITRTQKRESGSVVGGAAGGAARGAAVGAIGGAIAGDAGTGAAAGAAIGGLFGGARRHRENNEMVTVTEPNPEYEAYIQSKNAFGTAFETCLAQRAG